MRRIKQTFSVLVLLQIILVNNALAHVNNIKHTFSCNFVDHKIPLRTRLSDEITPCQQTESYSAVTVSSSPPCTPPSVPSAAVMQPSCTESTGTIIFDPQPVLYSIDDGATYQTSNVFSGVVPGVYDLRVADLADISCSTAGGTKYILGSYAPLIVIDPVDRTIDQNTNTFFRVTANHAFTYQWQVDTGSGFVNVVNDANYSGATHPTLTLTNTPLSFDTYTYQCIVIGDCFPNDTTHPAILTVNELVLGASELDFAYDVDNGRQNISDGVPTTSPNVRLIPTNVGGTSYTVEVNTASDFSGTSWSKTGN